MTASWGQGITSSPKEGLASGELVTWRSQPKRVPIPLEEAKHVKMVRPPYPHQLGIMWLEFESLAKEDLTFPSAHT